MTSMEEFETRERALAGAVAERKVQFEPGWRRILALAEAAQTGDRLIDE